MKTIEFTYDLEDIENIANNVLEALSSKTVLFYGGMASGKTTFINAILKALGSTDNASSPTFSIVNEYQLPNDKAYHFDFYRIDDISETLDFGIEDYFNNKHWLFIEWPTKIETLLQDNADTIEITVINPTKRTLKLTKNKNNLTETKMYVNQ